MQTCNSILICKHTITDRNVTLYISSRVDITFASQHFGYDFISGMSARLMVSYLTFVRQMVPYLTSACQIVSYLASARQMISYLTSVYQMVSYLTSANQIVSYMTSARQMFSYLTSASEMVSYLMSAWKMVCAYQGTQFSFLWLLEFLPIRSQQTNHNCIDKSFFYIVYMYSCIYIHSHTILLISIMSQSSLQ